jgi:hypothetical protein
MSKNVKSILISAISGIVLVWAPVLFGEYNSLTAFLMMIGIVITSYLVEKYLPPLLKKNKDESI